MTSRLKGAVIGTGYFSHFHFDAWNRIDEVDIVACCDVDSKKAVEVAGKYGISDSYDDVQVMLEAHKLDFVDIVTRPDTHLEIVRNLAERGLAMICQKPLAPDVEQIRQLEQCVRDSGVPFMVHENFRLQPVCGSSQEHLQQPAYTHPTKRCHPVCKYPGRGSTAFQFTGSGVE